MTKRDPFLGHASVSGRAPFDYLFASRGSDTRWIQFMSALPRSSSERCEDLVRLAHRRLHREHFLNERPTHLDVAVGTAVLDDDESIVGVGRVADGRKDDTTRDDPREDERVDA